MAKKRLTNEEIKKRLTWKNLLRNITDRGYRRSADLIADTANSFLKEWDQKITPQHINLYKSTPKKLVSTISQKLASSQTWDLRVPQTKEIANALVWSLEDLGVWLNISVDEIKEEQSQLIYLLGFEEMARPTGSNWTADIQPLATSLLYELTAGSMVLFDIPEKGPLSTVNPWVLNLIFQILVAKECTVHIYANETSRGSIALPTTYDTVVLLMLTASIIIQDNKKVSNAPVDCLKAASSAKILEASKKAIDIRDKHYGDIDSWSLTKKVFDFITQRLILFKPNECNWPLQQRYNPLTLILIKLAPDEQLHQQIKGYIAYDLEEARLLDDYSELQKYFTDRRRLGLVEQMVITTDEVCERAKRIAINLEIG